MKCNNFPTSNTTFTAQDLREGNRYEFRVLAVNEAGMGKPSKPSNPMTAKEQKSKYNMPYTFLFHYIIIENVLLFSIAEVPEAPEAPKPDRITKDSVVLSWRPPRFDGGAKIKEYVLEQKKKGDSDWSEVICPTIYSTLCTVMLHLIYFQFIIVIKCLVFI